MDKERVGGNNGDQGPMSPWEGLAAASTNDDEQQPDKVAAHEDMEMQGERRAATPMTFDDLRRIVTDINNVYRQYSYTKRNTKPDTQRQREEI